MSTSKLSSRILSLLMALVMVVSLIPVPAFAAAQTYKFGSAQTEIAPGKYDLPVVLNKADKPTQPSMAGSCVKGATLVVAEDGKARVTINLGPVSVSGITGWGSEWQVYTENSYLNPETLIPCEYTTIQQGKEEFIDSITFDMPDNSWDGVYTHMRIEVMGVYQDAFFKMDFAGATPYVEPVPVTFTAGANGTLTATVNNKEIKSGDLVKAGSKVIFTAKADEGYMVDSWTGVDATGNSVAVTADKALNVGVTFTEKVIKNYPVNFSAGANGALTASVDGKEIKSGDEVAEGTKVVFTAKPADGYMVDKWRGVTGEGNTAEAVVNGALDASVSFKLILDRTELDAAIAEADSIVASEMDYADNASWAKFVKRLDYAKNGKFSDQNDIEVAILLLTGAQADLTKLDKSAFSAAYDKFGVSWNGKAYAGYPKAVTKPCDEAVAVAQSYDSKRFKSQAEVDAVTEQMVVAYDGLQAYIQKDIKLVSIKHANGEETSYINIAEAFKAFKAGEDTEVTLLQNLELVDSVSGSKIPFNLNGFTLSVDGQVNVATLISAKANSVLNGNVKFNAETTLNANLTINGQVATSAKIIIDGAAINANGDAFIGWVPEIVVNSGSITSQTGYAINAKIDDGWGATEGQATKITINGGVLAGKDYAVKGITPVTVNGGQFKAAKAAVIGADVVAPEGQKLSLIADENGFFKLIPAETPENVAGVISVDGKEYASVEEAFKNITAGAQVKLLADADVTRYAEIAQNCTIDLNGHKLTIHPYNQDANHQKYYGDYWCVVKILEGVKVDVIDSSAEKTGILSQTSTSNKNAGFLVFGEMTVTDIKVDNQNTDDGCLILTFNTTKSRVVADNIHLADTNKGAIFNGGNEVGTTVLKNITETFDSQKDTLLQSDKIYSPAYIIENCHFTDAGSERYFGNNEEIHNTTWEFTNGGKMKFKVYAPSSAVLDTCTITTSSTNPAVHIEAYNTVKLTNCTIKNTEGPAVNFVNSTMKSYTIESGIYEGKDYAVVTDTIVVINDGQFKGAVNAVKGQSILPKGKTFGLDADGYYKLVDGIYNPFGDVTGKDAAVYDSTGSLLGGIDFAGGPVILLPNESKVILQKDVVVKGKVNLSMMNGGRYTIDLNGHKLEEKNRMKDALMFDKGTAVTFEDSIGTAVVNLTTPSMFALQITSAEGTEVIVNGGTWNADMFGQNSQGHMTFVDGHFNVNRSRNKPLFKGCPNFVVIGGDYNYDVSENVQGCDPLNHDTHDAYEKDGRWYVVPLNEMPAPEAPVITPESTKFQKGETIEVSMTAAEGTIYYTLDGSKPTSKSIKYEAPFTVDKTTTVTAVAILEGGRVSGFTEATYTMVDPNADLFFGSSNTKLEPGTYVVPISLRHAAKHQNPSAAVDAFPAVGLLTIDELGTATLETVMNPVNKAGLVDMAYDIKVYQEDNANSATKDVTVVETVTNPEGIYRPDASKDKVVPSKISFQIPNNKWDGVYMSLYVDAMASAPDAWLRLDYAKAVKPGTEQHFFGESKVDQFGKYTIVTDVSVIDGVITNVAVSAKDFISETHRPTNEMMIEKVTKALKDAWNGIAPVQDNAEKIFKTIMKNEDEPIDTVSGATYSAKAVRNAVMGAFELEYQDEVINVPQSVQPGVYEVEIGYYSDVVWHSLVENTKSTALLTVKEDGAMSLSFDTKSGTVKEPLYILGFNGVYENNDRKGQLTMDGCKTVMGLSSNDYSDEFFAKGTQVVNHVEFPLLGGLTKEYATNAYLYVPAMKKLNGEMSGVNFENGHFNVDIFAKVYWDTMNRIGDAPADNLPAPETNLTVKSTGKPYLTWTAVEGAEKYEVWCGVEGGSYEMIYDTSAGLRVTHNSAKVGETYFYMVRAIGADGVEGEFSEAVSAQCNLAAPKTQLTTKASTGKPYLTWNDVDGAEEYVVYRKVGKNGTYEPYYTTKGNRLTNTSAKPGVTYYYKVMAVAGDLKSAFSSVKYKTCDCARPDVKLTTRNGHPYLSWNKVDGAVKYEIYRSVNGQGYELLYTARGTHLTNSSAKRGQTCKYRVKAICSNKYGNSALSYTDTIKVK